ncbi:hypothetical protein GCM10009736_22160 [Actinomadura bangladeshensis]
MVAGTPQRSRRLDGRLQYMEECRDRFYTCARRDLGMTGPPPRRIAPVLRLTLELAECAPRRVTLLIPALTPAGRRRLS